MALVSTDSFDTYNGTGTNTGVQAKWTNTGGVTNTSLTSGRFGGQALRMNYTTGIPGQWYIRSFSANRASFAVGGAIRFSSVGNLQTTSGGAATIMFLGGGIGQFGLLFNSSGQIVAVRSGIGVQTPTVIGSSATGVVAANTYYFMEVEATISGTTGTITVYLDGVAKLTLTSINNKNNGSSAGVDQIGIVRPLGSSTSETFDFDDFYEADTNTRIGLGRVEVIRASADVAQGWTRSAGAVNYSLTNETLVDGDTTYVQASSVGDVDTYDFGALSSTPATIYGVQMVVFAEKTDATARSIALQAKSGATTSDGPDYVLTSLSYGRHERMMTVDPNTSAAWAASAVEAIRGGPKVTV